MYPLSFPSRSQAHSLQARKTKIAGAKRQVVRPQALRHLIPLVWRESVQLRAYSAEQAPTRRSLRVHRRRSVWHRVISLSMTVMITMLCPHTGSTTLPDWHAGEWFACTLCTEACPRRSMYHSKARFVFFLSLFLWPMEMHYYY
jgi:hypothetical protein